MEHTPFPLAAFKCRKRDIRLAFCRLTWRRMRGPRRKLGFILGILYWPFLAAYRAIGVTREKGQYVTKAYGIPRYKQYLHQLYLALIHGRPPHVYYMYGLFRPRQWQLAPRYITPQEFRGIVEALTPIGADTSLQDKFAFEAVCKQSGLPCIETIMVLGSTTLENTSPDNMKAHRLQECDLFIKPVSARSGSGTEMWSWTTSGFVNHRGEVRTSRELLEHLVQRSTSQAILVQRRIKNHRTISEHFGISALSTVRIVTTLTDAGQPNLFQALFKMPRKHSIVDNLGAGGIGCGVQLDTGRLEAGHVKANHESLHEHPDTGALITGFALPQWQEVRRTALDAHRAFSNVAIIGWDIGISDSGPVIIEGNPFPAVESLQQSHGPLEVNPNFWPFIRTAATNSQSVESNNYLA